MTDYTIKGELKLSTKQALAAIESVKKTLGSLATTSASSATPAAFSGVASGAAKAKAAVLDLEEQYNKYYEGRQKKEAFSGVYESTVRTNAVQSQLNSLKEIEITRTATADALEKQKLNTLRVQNAVITQMAKKQASGNLVSPLTLTRPMNAKAFDSYVKSSNDAIKNTEKLKNATGELKDEYSSMDQAIGVVKRGLVGMFAFGAIAGLTNFIKDSYKLAATLEDLRTGARHISEEFSIAGESIAASMKRSSQGILSEAETLKRVNQAALLGGKELAEAMPELFNIVRVNARAMGIDTGYALESMTIGLGRLSARWLDNLGIVIDTRASYRRLADDLGKAVGELTDAERRTALVGEVIRKYGVDSSESIRTTSESVQALSSSWDEVSAAIGRTITKRLILAGIEEKLNNFAAGQEVVNQAVDLSDKMETVAEYAGWATDEWTKFHKLSVQLSRTQYGIGDPFELMLQSRNELRYLLSTMEKVEAIDLGKKLGDDWEEYARKVHATVEELNGPSPRKAETILFNTEESDAALKSALNSVKGYADAMDKAGVPLRVVKQYVLDARKEFRELEIQLEKTPGSLEKQHLLNDWLRDSKKDADDLTDSFVNLGQQVASIAPLMSEFGEYEVSPLSIQALQTLASINKRRYDNEKAERDKETSALKKKQSEYKSYYNSISSYAEQAALANLGVTASDFDSDRLDAPLEAVRRLRDIAKLGTGSPWYKVFEVPDDVVASGERAIRKWAKEMADRGADLRDISLIDKDAFLRELQNIETAKKERAATVAQLTQWAIEAGFSPDTAKQYAGDYVGDPSADGIVEGIKSKMAALNPGLAVNDVIRKSAIAAEDTYKTTGGIMGQNLWLGIQKYLEEHMLSVPVAIAMSGAAPEVTSVTYDSGEK